MRAPRHSITPAPVRAVIDQLIGHIARFGDWSYLIFFLGAALECSAFIGLLVPGETLVLMSGFLANRGVLDLGDLMIVVTAGAIVGDSIGYELGRRLGRPWLLHYGRWAGIHAAHLEQADAFFGRHGGKTVFLGRFVGFLRALGPFVAGSLRMPYGQFLTYNALGGALWTVSFVLLGYGLGEGWRSAEHWLGRASAIVGVALLFMIGVAQLWRWLARHEAEVRQRWSAVIGHRWVVRVRRRLAPLRVFIEARLSPQGYFGLRMTVGAFVLIAASWIFGGIAESVVGARPLTVLDANLATWLHERVTPGLTSVMLAVSAVGSPTLAAVATVVLSGILSWRREWYRLLALLLSVPGGLLLNTLLQSIFRRARPEFSDPILTLTSYGFPSGHTMAATVWYGYLTALAVSRLSTWRWRVFAVLVAGVVILLVAFSRLYLGAHYLSDVLAAMAEGLAWLALCVTAVDTLRRARTPTRRAGAGSAE
jgi:membrane protein DedA with SNARE-associated domain/membrane-associated phospholipid phosphatase